MSAEGSWWQDLVPRATTSRLLPGDLTTRNRRPAPTAGKGPLGKTGQVLDEVGTVGEGVSRRLRPGAARGKRSVAVMAAAMAGGQTAVITGRAAAAARGFGHSPLMIDVVRAEGLPLLIRGDPPHHRTAVQVRRAKLQPWESQQLGPLPVASTDRILADLAGELSDRDLRRYFIEAGRTGLLTPECLAHIAACDRRYKGRSRLGHLVDLWDPTKGRIRSILEGEFRLMCAEQGLPLPLTNQKIGRYEVDCLWEDVKLVVELDGRKFHADPFALELDSEKTRALRAMGFRVLRFSWYEVTTFPEEVARRIRQEMDSARAAQL